MVLCLLEVLLVWIPGLKLEYASFADRIGVLMENG